ncbi:hypothetical protein SADUNF_Sadunf17G0074300 [Salix dunnii]|uniref:START domain-containing protein n=1 Tax=Salix dunnii TaxID=1413687 RepID=A0A835J511_9ROSI|nr:hypothetical protein SADUNF_Sadunf17G0074300 [Salix dunnii]
MTLEVLSTGVARNYNGALQVITAEFQLSTPLVPTRESYYVRYYKQHADGTWVVVDVSLDNIRPSPTPRCRRRPSECLIQEMPNGYSKVKWWVATLDRQYERLTSAMTTNIPAGDAGVITNQKGRKSMTKLAKRMTISFYAGVSASSIHTICDRSR